MGTVSRGPEEPAPARAGSLPVEVTPEAPRAAAPARGFAGVDEAGRGPVLGPLVVAGVLVDDDAPLREIGVADSKTLTAAKREAFFDAVHDAAARVAVRVVDAAELDARMTDTTLNVVEVELFAEVLAELGAPAAFVDAADVNAARFGTRVGARLPHDCTITSEHKADARHPCVAAASIVAKVTRDRAVRALQDACGRRIGSGYAHDPVTRRFLAEWVEEHGDVPAFARRRWETCARLLNRNRTLTDFS